MSGISTLPSWENILTYYDKLQNVSIDDAELIAKKLLDEPQILKSIPCIKRAYSDGKTKRYRGKNSKRRGVPQNPKSDVIFETTNKHRRDEEYRAMELYCKYKVGNVENDLFGNILDYQTPLGGSEKYLGDDKRLENISFKKRNIDLISYKSNEDTIYLLELKVPGSTEPLIRISLEAYTYLRMLNKEDFKDNMRDIYPDLGINATTSFKCAPLIYEGSIAARQYGKLSKYPYEKRLLEKLEIEPFILDNL